MSRLLSIFAAVVAIVAGAIILLQHSEISRLRAERAALEGKAPPVDLAVQEETLPAARQPETGAAASDATELFRLRNEVTQLRGEQQRAQKVEAENQLLKSQIAVLRSNAEHLGTRRFSRAADIGELLPEARPPMNAWIGLMLTPGGSNAPAVVNGVAPNSPAAQAQLQEGDAIVGIDGVAVTNLLQVRNTIATRQPGQMTLLQIWRNGAPQQVYVTPQAPPR